MPFLLARCWSVNVMGLLLSFPKPYLKFYTRSHYWMSITKYLHAPKLLPKEWKSLAQNQQSWSNRLRTKPLHTWSDKHQIDSRYFSLEAHLLSTLKLFNFGPDNQRWIEVIYHNVSSCVLNNKSHFTFISIPSRLQVRMPHIGFFCNWYWAFHKCFEKEWHQRHFCWQKANKSHPIRWWYNSVCYRPSVASSPEINKSKIKWPQATIQVLGIFFLYNSDTTI